jgi:hypothetical protein
MFRASSAHHQESLTVHTASIFCVCVCLRHCLVRNLFSVYMCITVHVSSVKRSSSRVPHRTYSLQFLCLCLSAALSCKKLYYKLHLLVYLLGYMKMHGPGNIKKINSGFYKVCNQCCCNVTRCRSLNKSISYCSRRMNLVQL